MLSDKHTLKYKKTEILVFFIKLIHYNQRHEETKPLHNQANCRRLSIGNFFTDVNYLAHAVSALY